MMKNKMKIIMKCIGLLLLLIFLVNVIEPAFHKEVSEEQREIIEKTEYESELPDTERICCIDDNEDALLWRLRMIGAAKENIVLTTFDFREDESGKDVMAALYHAADRGVKVQILVDGIYQILYLRDSDLFQALSSHENVDARFYNIPNLKNIWRANYRMHDKYIMIDDSMYLLGGRNTNDIFLGDYKKHKNIDREILVYETEQNADNSFHSLHNYFYKIWNDECVKSAKVEEEKDWNEEYSQLEKRYQDLCDIYADIENYDSWYEDTIPADKITLIHNGTKAERKEPVILECLEELLTKSESVFIQTPYAICNGKMYDMLSRINESADVSIILNAVEKGSNPWGCTDYLNNKNKLLNTGATIYELMNEQAVHTKTVLADDNLSIVGSYNFDMRSTYLDTELMLVIDCVELNTHIRDMCENYKGKSIEVLPDGVETVGAEYEAKDLTWQKQIFYGILRVIIMPFRHLL